jgi:hypothetical protein
MRRELLISLLLICITLALYGQVLNHQFVYFDDTLYVTLMTPYTLPKTAIFKRD